MMDCSTFLLDLLAKVSPNLDRTLPALMIRPVVTRVFRNHPVNLQVAFAVKMAESEVIFNDMSSYGVVCTYSESSRFKKSAAQAAVEDKNHMALSSSEVGLVQAVTDNFDTDICSPNSKVSTHSIAIVMTQ